MPYDIVHVHRVTKVPTAKNGLDSYLVTTHEGPQFFTLNQFRAALCDSARAIQAPVCIWWKDGRMRTRDIVDVELVGAA